MAHQGWVLGAQRTLKLEQHPCVRVLASVQLCLLLAYYSKSEIIKITSKPEKGIVSKEKWKGEIRSRSLQAQ